MTTNITDEHCRAFNALTGGEAGNFCLFISFPFGPARGRDRRRDRLPAHRRGRPLEYVISPLPISICRRHGPDRP